MNEKKTIELKVEELEERIAPHVTLPGIASAGTGIAGPLLPSTPDVGADLWLGHRAD